MAVAEASRSSDKTSASAVRTSKRSRRAHPSLRTGVYAPNWPPVQVNIAQEATKNVAITVPTSGLMSSGGLDVSVGTRDQRTDQKNTRTTAAASTVGSTGGNVTITAGQTYTQRGSDVLASATTPGAGNIDITAKKVDIVEARETSASQTETKFEQSGITLPLAKVWRLPPMKS